ncbi:peptidoglycan-associated lipoprotein Pal [Oceanospirillum linum]|uniref:Peptidoglycan-associated lipoprotein n=1 Tax=Oceanospirillum linum TaxID=966 RepID=A0A1T1HCP6_OCELI|nr:peptidoglycan-associated lipoprotein Pal [Oceanospirillum linum]OOV87573.1 peptidoglycan-associated lipoprotein [Oceanospirillum linum]SEF92188.1 peptidoglycan-associated lipoprotein [Oleiphilus messinensis]SMP12783.1 peptidoglycan-associated lipoprotein [Oceanospirillum linum]
MEFKKYSKTLFFGATLAVLAGCGGNAATQEQGSDSASDGQVQPVVTSDGSNTDSSVNGEQMGQDAQSMKDQAADAMAAMPEVETVYFGFDTSAIRDDSREVLDLHVAYLNANPMQNVVLEGHADERGTREYNNALGERRGNAVKSYFMVQGVSADRIEVISYGEEKPAVIGHNNAAWSKNRRVEIKY